MNYKKLIDHITEFKPSFMNWISVKDRLPEIITWPSGYQSSDKILLITDDKDIYVGEYDYDENEFITDSFFRLKTVTHWMPLPEPPPKNQEMNLKGIIEANPETCPKALVLLHVAALAQLVKDGAIDKDGIIDLTDFLWEKSNE